MKIVRSVDEIDVYDLVKEWLKNQTKHLMQARSFIERKGFKRK